MVDAGDPSPLPTQDGFQRLRAPLLGLAVEHNASSGDYRLVTADEKPEVLRTGTLEDCETALLERLKEKHGTGKVNAPLPTLGGKQFWADRFVFAGWRVQENVYTGHCRLLDSEDFRKAWGSYEACRVALEEERQKRGLKRRSPRTVVLLHGLFRSKDSFGPLAERLEEAGYEVVDVNYPSTRRSLREHSRQVEEVLNASDGMEEVSFVTHSLGGIVVRDLLSLDSPWRKSARLRRIVMLAPPNQGSDLAETLKEWFPFQAAAGKVGQELTPEIVGKLPVPSCELGIIAGGAGNDQGYNPLLPGDDDMVITVECTKLEGASDFLVVPATHTFIMRRPEVRDAVMNFLEKGRFSNDREPTPIRKAGSPPAGDPPQRKDG